MAIVYDDNGVAGKVCTRCHTWKPLSSFKRRLKQGTPVGDGYLTQCRDCQNADERARRAADPESYRQKARAYMAKRREQSNAYQRAWRQSNADKVQASLRLYRVRNREKINAAARTRRDANLEYYRAIGRASRARHREERNAASRAYFKTHREKARAAQNRRRARKLRAEGSHTQAEWEALKAQYDYTCLCCGRREPEIELHKDHVIPLAEGGTDYISNLQPLCGPCNSKKSNKTIDYRGK